MARLKNISRLRWHPLFAVAFMAIAVGVSALVRPAVDRLLLPRLYRSPSAQPRAELRVINNDGTLSNGDKLTRARTWIYFTASGAGWTIMCAAATLLLLRLWPVRKEGRKEG